MAPRLPRTLLLAAVLAACGEGPGARPPVDPASVQGSSFMDPSPALEQPAPDEPSGPLPTAALAPASEPVVPEPAAAEFPQGPRPYEEITFDLLRGFDWTAPEFAQDGTARPRAVDPYPSAVRALDGRNVKVRGYMLPLELEHGTTTRFALMHSLASCCFGGNPMINEWIDVRMAEGERALYASFTPYMVSGRISVGDEVVSGTVISVYRMTAVEAEIVEPEDW